VIFLDAALTREAGALLVTGVALYAARWGLEGIVSKRCSHWLKIKNSAFERP
jgi:hypothetical protein